MVFLSLAGCEAGKAAAPAAPQALEVEVATVSEQSVTITSEWIATLDGYVNAQIRPQVSGYLVKRNYREGAAVRKGDVLFEIDPRPFNTALAQARAQVAQAEAQLAKSARDFERDTPLAEQRAIARSQLDAEIQEHRGAHANVQSLRAGVEAAELNVGFMRRLSGHQFLGKRYQAHTYLGSDSSDRIALGNRIAGRQPTTLSTWARLNVPVMRIVAEI